MSDTVLTSPSRPKLFTPGQSSLEPGVERYVLKGGGTAVFELDKGDRIELSPLEGGQGVEIAAFAPGGKSDLGALGLKGKGKPTGIQKALESDSEDAQRVRFGLFRRGLDIGRVKAAHVLGADSVPGDVAALQARTVRSRDLWSARRADDRLGSDTGDRHSGLHSESQSAAPQ